MPQVKWWIANKIEAAKQGKTSRFIEANLEELLLNWDDDATTAEKTDVKFIKVTFGRTNVIEFCLFSSENYTRGQNSMYSNLPILFDRYQLTITRVNLKFKLDQSRKRWEKSETAMKVLQNVESVGTSKPDPKCWVDLDKLNEIVMEIDELMESLEEYELMDRLTFDDYETH